MLITEAVVLAIIEGVTEFLPVSSTGHMIIGSSLLGIAEQDFTKLFTIAIQLGAILSVVVLYWRRFLKTWDFYVKLFVAFLPSMILGKLLANRIDLMLGNVLVVASSLLLGGTVLILVDQWIKGERREGMPTYPEAIVIGFFQVLAMVPGVSRAAATIFGGLSRGLSRKAAAEFSFFLAVPTMLAATVYKLYEYHQLHGGLAPGEILILLLGNVIAFVVAILAIRAFIEFLNRNGFRVFGYYRIVVGSIVLILYYAGLLPHALP